MTSKEESEHATGEGHETKEVEVQLAEMETRLRSVILSIIRPSLDKAHDLDTRLKDLSEEVAGHESALFTVDKLRAEVAKQKEFTASLGDQLRNRDQLSQEFEHRTGNDLQDIRVKVEMLEQRQEDLQKELRQQVRDAQHTWNETQHLAEHHETSMRQVYEHISAGDKKEAQAREEIMEQVRELQKHREDLLEDLFGEEKGITKLGHELTKVFRITASIPGLTNSLAILSDKVETLDVKETGLENRLGQSETEFQDFTKEIQAKLRVMKEEFRQDTNRLIAHNATIMKDIRQDYIDEMMAVAKVRTEIMQFQTNIDTICRDIAEALEKETRRIDALHRELVEDIEEIQRRRKKDRISLEEGVQDARREVAMEQALSLETRGKLEFLSRIIGLMLEGERVVGALCMQDFADRGCERWLAPKSDMGRGPAPPQSAETLEQLLQRQNWRQDTGWNTLQSDGSMQLLDARKGFALGGYTPGRISFGGTLFDRQEILLMHHKLLQKAHGAFVAGPPGEAALALDGKRGRHSSVPASALPVSTAQFTVKGSVSAKEAPWGARDERDGTLDEKTDNQKVQPLKQGSADGGSHSRGRPGSQDQPQALGSRGGALGPLGETEPPWQAVSLGAAAPVKLPRISGSGGVQSVSGTGSTFASTGLSSAMAGLVDIAYAETGKSFSRPGQSGALTAR